MYCIINYILDTSLHIIIYTTISTMSDSELLERLAAEELLSEAKRGAARASLSGPSGWQKCPLPKTNKKFLNNTLLHTLSANRLRNNTKNVERKSEVDGEANSKSDVDKNKNIMVSSKPLTSSLLKSNKSGPTRVKKYNFNHINCTNVKPYNKSESKIK